jgi:hypothetical protein
VLSSVVPDTDWLHRHLPDGCYYCHCYWSVLGDYLPCVTITDYFYAAVDCGTINANGQVHIRDMTLDGVTNLPVTGGLAAATYLAASYDTQCGGEFGVHLGVTSQCLTSKEILHSGFTLRVFPPQAGRHPSCWASGLQLLHPTLLLVSRSTSPRFPAEIPRGRSLLCHIDRPCK